MSCMLPISIRYKSKNWEKEKSDECMLLNPKTIVYIRKPTLVEIDYFKDNGIDVPKCLIGTTDGKEIRSYNIDFLDGKSILKDVVADL